MTRDGRVDAHAVIDRYAMPTKRHGHHLCTHLLTRSGAFERARAPGTLGSL